MDFYTSNDPSVRLSREERMHILPILCKYCKDHPNVIEGVQLSLVDDMAYCRV